MNKQELISTARATIAAMTTLAIVEAYEATNKMELTSAVIMTRGWLMEELDARQPEAMAAWDCSEDFEESPRKFLKF